MEIADSVFQMKDNISYIEDRRKPNQFGLKTINIKYGDGYKGLQEHQPSDKILQLELKFH